MKHKFFKFASAWLLGLGSLAQAAHPAYLANFTGRKVTLKFLKEPIVGPIFVLQSVGGKLVRHEVKLKGGIELQTFDTVQFEVSDTSSKSAGVMFDIVDSQTNADLLNEGFIDYIAHESKAGDDDRGSIFPISGKKDPEIDLEEFKDTPNVLILMPKGRVPTMLRAVPHS
jgi:hypothetical protein